MTCLGDVPAYQVAVVAKYRIKPPSLQVCRLYSPSVLMNGSFILGPAWQSGTILDCCPRLEALLQVICGGSGSFPPSADLHPNRRFLPEP